MGKNPHTERALVEEMAQQLNMLDGYKAYCHRRPVASKPLKEYLSDRLGFNPILQPELDLVVRTPDGRLCAVEVKLFRRKDNYFTTPYYLGVGQALALAGYGFDHVGLWFFFQDEDMEQVEQAHGSSAWHLVRNKLQLPLEFSFFAIRKNNGQIKFDVMKYTSEYSFKRLISIDNPRFRITWKNPNPLVTQSSSKEIRRAIDLWLDWKLPNY